MLSKLHAEANLGWAGDVKHVGLQSTEDTCGKGQLKSRVEYGLIDDGKRGCVENSTQVRIKKVSVTCEDVCVWIPGAWVGISYSPGAHNAFQRQKALFTKRSLNLRARLHS